MANNIRLILGLFLPKTDKELGIRRSPCGEINPPVGCQWGHSLTTARCNSKRSWWLIDVILSQSAGAVLAELLFGHLYQQGSETWYPKAHGVKHVRTAEPLNPADISSYLTHFRENERYMIRVVRRRQELWPGSLTCRPPLEKIWQKERWSCTEPTQHFNER